MQRQGENAAHAHKLEARERELGTLIASAQKFARALEAELCGAVNFIRHARGEREAIQAALAGGGVQ